MTKVRQEKDLQEVPADVSVARRRRKKLYIEKHLRLHADYVTRLDELNPWLEEQPDLAPAGSLKLADRLRLAVRIGIETLEARQKSQT